MITVWVYYCLDLLALAGIDGECIDISSVMFCDIFLHQSQCNYNTSQFNIDGGCFWLLEENHSGNCLNGSFFNSCFQLKERGQCLNHPDLDSLECYWLLYKTQGLDGGCWEPAQVYR
jgi:hypothetical protein